MEDEKREKKTKNIISEAHWARPLLLCSFLQERLRVSVATLQSSIGTLATDVAETKKKQHEAMMDIMTTQTSSVGHTLVDLDSRVENLSMRLQVRINTVVAKFGLQVVVVVQDAIALRSYPCVHDLFILNVLAVTLFDPFARSPFPFLSPKESESVLQNRISGLSSASSMSEVADLLSNLNARVASLTQWQEGTQQGITRYLLYTPLIETSEID